MSVRNGLVMIEQRLVLLGSELVSIGELVLWHGMMEATQRALSFWMVLPINVFQLQGVCAQYKELNGAVQQDKLNRLGRMCRSVPVL